MGDMDPSRTSRPRADRPHTDRPRVRDLVPLLEDIAPPELAETWDNGGLTLGDPDGEVGWVAVALDAADFLAAGDPAATAAAYPEAPRPALPPPSAACVPEGPGLLVTHHPLPFRPLGRLLETDPAGRLALALARRGVNLYAAHTSFDAAPEGLSHRLGLAIGLDPGTLRPLVPPGAAGAFYKLVVFVPATHAGAVRVALASAGAGWIGNYSDTAFAAPGRGYFRPREGADPFIGVAGRVEEVAEDRVETIVPAHRLAATLRRMREAHPYEEPAYDIYPLASHPPVTRPELQSGIGRVGDLAGPAMTLSAFRDDVERRLGLPSGTVRLLAQVGPARTVRRVAVCPGAGGDYLRDAAAAGADAYVTGDLTYHQVVDAAVLGLALLDAGHRGTERLFVPEMAGRLAKSFASQGIPLEVIEIPTPSGWAY